MDLKGMIAVCGLCCHECGASAKGKSIDKVATLD